MKKNYLISQRHSQNQHGDWVDSLENNYIKIFEFHNINLIPVANISTNVQNICNDINISGIILTGGGDVDPLLYNGNSDQKLILSDERDKTEASLLSIAIERKIPVLGICRGMQFINVFFRGKILQDIKSIDKERKHLTPGNHPIKLNYQLLIEMLKKDIVEVNSYHNQGIQFEMLGEGLLAFAEYSELSLVEGFFHAQYPIAGIIWHPERKQSEDHLDKILIESFLNRKLFWK